MPSARSRETVCSENALAGMISVFLKKESLDMSMSSLGFLHTVCERFGREEKYKSVGCYKDLIAKQTYFLSR